MDGSSFTSMGQSSKSAVQAPWHNMWTAWPSSCAKTRTSSTANSLVWPQEAEENCRFTKTWPGQTTAAPARSMGAGRRLQGLDNSTYTKPRRCPEASWRSYARTDGRQPASKCAFRATRRKRTLNAWPTTSAMPSTTDSAGKYWASLKASCFPLTRALRKASSTMSTFRSLPVDSPAGVFAANAARSGDLDAAKSSIFCSTGWSLARVSRQQRSNNACASFGSLTVKDRSSYSAHDA
mmetsp:Transcript_98219/g.274979  ORF Transcript_98219/g.274979 Transcript_98219/m.274979 type:complete len:237 (-) Transcript_98219:664-1374(-)